MRVGVMIVILLLTLLLTLSKALSIITFLNITLLILLWYLLWLRLIIMLCFLNCFMRRKSKRLFMRWFFIMLRVLMASILHFRKPIGILLKMIFVMFFLFFSQGNVMPRYFSFTTFVLIPKKENPKFWTYFHPISLCTFLTKSFSKAWPKGLVVYFQRLVQELI